MSNLSNEERCDHCGHKLEHWDDVAGALRSMIEAAPVGLRPLMLQAAQRLEAADEKDDAQGYWKAWAACYEALTENHGGLPAGPGNAVEKAKAEIRRLRKFESDVRSALRVSEKNHGD